LQYNGNALNARPLIHRLLPFYPNPNLPAQGGSTNVTFVDLIIRNGGNSGVHVSGSNPEVFTP